MLSRRGPLALVAAVCVAVVASAVAAVPLGLPVVEGVPLDAVLVKGLWALAVVCGVYGAYALTAAVVVTDAMAKGRRTTVQDALRLGFFLAGGVAVLGVVTDQWLGALVSLGVVGVAASLALQQPLLSVLGWVYIATKHPYRPGDRVAIDGSKGDVADIDFLVTTLWEIDGELVASNQPSGRQITVPNSAVLNSHVFNYSQESFPYVWNEVPVQLAYETDLQFARETAREVVDDYLGDEMAARIGTYRDLQSETPVSFEVSDRPSVNVAARETWVELRVRYLVEPRSAQRVRNALYERLLAAYNDHPDRVKFLVGRSR